MSNTPAEREAIARRCRYVRLVITGDKHGAKAEMARRAGVTRMRWYGYEQGTSVPAIKVLSRIRDVFGIPPDYILLGDRRWTGDYRDALAEAEGRQLVKNDD